MADVYCANCFGLISDRDARCKFCKRANARRQLDPVLGTISFSIIIGAVCTGVFARVLYLSWPTWQKIFETKGLMPESHANEAAIFAGILVFLMSALFAGMAVRHVKGK